MFTLFANEYEWVCGPVYVVNIFTKFLAPWPRGDRDLSRPALS